MVIVKVPSLMWKLDAWEKKDIDSLLIAVESTGNAIDQQ